jgi:hypothetical protein
MNLGADSPGAEGSRQGVAPEAEGGKTVEERTILTALGNIVDSLGTLSLVATAPDDPLALPEPPAPEQVAVYETHVSAIKAQVAASYHSLLGMSVRDYQAGYADRAGLYLLEFLGKLKEEPDYDRNFSAGGQRTLATYIADLREL